MTSVDETFYQNQCVHPQIGYCTNFTTRKDILAQKQKEKEYERHLKLSEKSKNDIKLLEKNESTENLSDEEAITIDDEENTNDKDYVLNSTKSSFNESFFESGNDDMPMRYRHIRVGERRVKPEYYLLMHVLESKYHMSENMAQGAIIEVANYLFGRKEHGEWKPYKPGEVSDCNTLQSPSNTNRTEPYIEAMILSHIVEEIMCSDSNSVVTYSNDGSSLNRTGNFVVQSFHVNGKQRALPTLGIFMETKKSLAELIRTTLKILSAATGYMYSENQIMQIINFVMTDSTSHSLGVIEMVCEEIESEYVPSSLVCNIHPLMMMQRKVKELFQIIHDKIGNTEINKCFYVDVDFRNESFPFKAIRCLTSFINRDFSTKPWNRQKHFDAFIHPKTNESLSLKDHRFNRIFECYYSLVHHIEDIKSYLEKFTNVVNGLNIIDRSFLDMEVLKPIFCATSLIGIHITGPYLELLVNTSTNYDTLSEAFPKLYEELENVKGADMLNTEQQIFNFVEKKLFLKSLPKECMLTRIEACMQEYKKENINILNVLLPMLAEGFSMQRGALFGFGPKANESTGTLLKISAASEAEKQKLNKAPIHNLNEERSVGFITHEVSIRGPDQLEPASKKMILNKSIDLLEKTLDKPKTFLSFKKASESINEIKLKWTEKLKSFQADGYSKQECLNLRKESEQLELLEFLKLQEFPGPFTKPTEVKEFMQSDLRPEEKQKRLKKEVKYARMSCTTMKETHSVFRLKNYLDLDAEEYADNLISYLDNARSVRSITLNDLNNVLHGLANTIPLVNPDSQNKDGFVIGEYVAAFWLEGATYKWHLGVVENIHSDQTIVISYLIRADPKGKTWVFPDEAQLEETGNEQILMRNILVSYMRSVRIKCKIENDLNVIELDKAIEHLNQ